MLGAGPGSTGMCVAALDDDACGKCESALRGQTESFDGEPSSLKVRTSCLVQQGLCRCSKLNTKRLWEASCSIASSRYVGRLAASARSVLFNLDR